jgi:hypothetical protein
MVARRPIRVQQGGQEAALGIEGLQGDMGAGISLYFGPERETPIPDDWVRLFFSFPDMRLGFAALVLTFLGACGNWKTDPATLTARSGSAPQNVLCRLPYLPPTAR